MHVPLLLQSDDCNSMRGQLGTTAVGQVCGTRTQLDARPFVRLTHVEAGVSLQTKQCVKLYYLA